MKSSIPNAGGTFQPLRHRSGTMRDRLHGYTKRTLGAGGSVTEAVSLTRCTICMYVRTRIDT
jgi:MOB kinase activator 1